MMSTNGHEPWTLDAVKRVVTQYLLLPDSSLVIEVVIAAVVANRRDGDPFWLFIVNPPSGVKTELIRALNDVEYVYPLSNLTPQTFASGFETKKAEPSLLMRLDGHILTLKDFTTILTMHRDKRGEILAQLREIYDGHYKKEFGNGKIVDWTGKIGLIAGVTQIIDTYSSVSQVLGERFVNFRVRSQGGAAVAERAVNNQGNEKEMRQALRGAIAGFIRSIDLTQEVSLPAHLVTKIAHLATFCATGRSVVMRDWRGDIEYIPEAEGPARLAKQLALFGKALALTRSKREVTEEEYLVLYRLAEDTLPRHKHVTLSAFLKDPDLPQSTTTVASKTRYPTNTARRYLEDLAAMQLLERIIGGPGKADTWKLSTYCVDLLEKAAPDAEADEEPPSPEPPGGETDENRSGRVFSEASK